MKKIMIVDTLQIMQANGAIGVNCSCQAQECAFWIPAVITAIICATILIIAIVGMVLYFIGKIKERENQNESTRIKREQTMEDRKLTMEANLRDKLLKHLEDRLYTSSFSEIQKDKAYREDKEYDNEACKTYCTLLENMINEAKGK